MERLVECLKIVDLSDLPDDEEYPLIATDHNLICVIRCTATDVLINDNGTPNFEEMDRLYRDYGYFIYPGERDSFGWISACLQTKKGFIVFG
jgi:hypothetical protein